MFWALLNGEKEIGISIHKMDEKIDNGRLFAFHAEIRPHDSRAYGRVIGFVET